jgi:hypothetical protein
MGDVRADKPKGALMLARPVSGLASREPRELRMAYDPRLSLRVDPVGLMPLVARHKVGVVAQHVA